jgi:hypothetical protein
MASDLARLFALAHDYYLHPSQYHSRAEAYDIKCDLYMEFIDLLMNPGSSNQQTLIIANKLHINSNDVLTAGINFMQKIIFSANRNHYEVLGVKQNASTDLIKKRYRYLIAMFHPDKCAAHHLDGELYAALLNNAYNTLKNESSRKSYDEALIASAKASYRHVRAANDLDIKSRKKTVANKGSLSIVSIFEQISFFHRYPKLTVWGFLGACFAVMIYLSSLDSVVTEPTVKVAVKPAIEIRQVPPVDTIEETRNKDSEKDELGVDYLEKTINSDQLFEILGEQSVVDESEIKDVKIASETVLGLDSGFDGDAAGTPTEILHEQSAEDESEIKEVKIVSETVLDLGSGFDGGTPGTQTDVHNLLDEGGRIGTPLRLETFLIPPELIMMEFVESYETGNIDKFSRLFIDDVKTNHGRGRQQLVSQFSSLFDTTISRKIRIKQLRVEPQSRQEALLISNIEAVVKESSESDARHFNGEIVFRLITDDSNMQIAEMAHSVH